MMPVYLALQSFQLPASAHLLTPARIQTCSNTSSGLSLLTRIIPTFRASHHSRSLDALDSLIIRLTVSLILKTNFAWMALSPLALLAGYSGRFMPTSPSSKTLTVKSSCPSNLLHQLPLFRHSSMMQLGQDFHLTVVGFKLIPMILSVTPSMTLSMIPARFARTPWRTCTTALVNPFNNLILRLKMTCLYIGNPSVAVLHTLGCRLFQKHCSI